MLPREREPDRVRQPLPGQPVQQRVGRAGPVDPDQDLAAGAGARLVIGSWQRVAQHRDVVGGGAAVGVPRPQKAASGAVVEERPERMVAVAPLERRPGVLLVAVRGHQRRVDIHDQRRLRARLVIRRVLSGELPDPGAGHRPRR